MSFDFLKQELCGELFLDILYSAFCFNFQLLTYFFIK